MPTERLRLSNSSIKAVLRCEQLYEYKYVQELQPKRVALPLKKGSWVHLLLQAKYVDGAWQKVHEKLTRQFSALWDEEKEYYGDLPAQTQTIMEGYDWHWRDDAKIWTIKETELPIEVPLGKSWLYVGKIDVVAERERELWLWDHKTFRGKAPSSDYRTLDPQSALYDWAYEKITGRKPAGFLFNYLRTKLPTEPKLLKKGNGQLSRAAKIDTNYYTLLRFLKQNKLEPQNYRQELAAAKARDSLFYDRVEIPKPTAVIRSLLLDIQETVPRVRELHEGRRPVRTLTIDCVRCSYHLLCLTEMTGGSGEYIKKQDFRVGSWEEYDGLESSIIEET